MNELRVPSNPHEQLGSARLYIIQRFGAWINVCPRDNPLYELLDEPTVTPLS